MKNQEIKFIAPVLAILFFSIIGCKLGRIDKDVNVRYVRINVEPEDARVVVKSMEIADSNVKTTDSKEKTLTSPYVYRYILHPNQEIPVKITKEGYHPKVVVINGMQEEINVKLDKIIAKKITAKKPQKEIPWWEKDDLEITHPNPAFQDPRYLRFLGQPY